MAVVSVRFLIKNPWEDMMKKSVIRSFLSATTCLAVMATSPASAGDYDGVTIDAKLIGGQQCLCNS